MLVAEVLTCQPDIEERVRGPPVKVSQWIDAKCMYQCRKSFRHYAVWLHECSVQGLGECSWFSELGLVHRALSQGVMPWQAAYGKDGMPSKALLGFCARVGVDTSAVDHEADSRGTEYIWATRQEVGRPAAEVRMD